MGDDPSKIGLQHPAFAVSKKVLLDWLNDFFELNYVKVEECASGAIYCQILDAIYPGKVPMSRVNWKAKNDYEFVNNFKIVQGVMNKQNITKPVHIDKLVKAKYQDNLEFLQWFKHFFECRYGGQEYNARSRRGAKGPAKKKTGSAPSRAAARPTSARTATKAAPKASSGAGKGSAADKEKIAELQTTVEGLEKERDFYFGKLREVEVLCQAEDSDQGTCTTKAELVAAVLAILYKVDDEEEGEGAEEAAPEEDGDETF